MSVSIVLTINNRPPHVSREVADSLDLEGNQADELIVVLDRPTPEAKEGAMETYADCLHTVRFVEVTGDPGWKGPAVAWNMGFAAATSDLLYCISSEVVQERGNVKKAVELAKDGKPVLAYPWTSRTVVFGACHNSQPDNLVIGAEPGVLVNASMPRPLGFIVCMPRKAVESIGGFDEEFMKGFWFDDDDFFLRLWNTGLDFLFTDSIHGIHLHHERQDLDTPEGQRKIGVNRDYMLQKHKTTHPWPQLLKTTIRGNGQTRWVHR